MNSVSALKPKGEQPLSAVPYHVGIIPDGNRRYARKAGVSVEEGYLAAADKALEVIDWCLRAVVRHLSAFGVSRENIAQRPVNEVRWLHKALLRFCNIVSSHHEACLHLFGDASGLPSYLPERDELIRLQDASSTRDAQLVVHVGVNYSGQAELATLIRAVRKHGLSAVETSPEEFALSAGLPPVDLVVRTGGQQRLSGFLPLQTAYAELWFTPTYWPDFEREEFQDALAWFARQERRFGE